MNGRPSRPPQQLSPLRPAIFFRAVRIFRRWSRRELALRAGVRESRVAAIERGAVPTLDELDRLWTSFHLPFASTESIPSAHDFEKGTP